MSKGVHGSFEHSEFFRFRSPVNKEAITGGRGGIWWLESIKYIDLSPEQVIDMAFQIGMISKGTILMSDMLKMTAKELSYCFSRAQELAKNMKEQGDE